MLTNNAKAIVRLRLRRSFPFGAALAALILALCLPMESAVASESAELMNRFERLCIDNPMNFAAISSAAATDHLPIADQRTTAAGGMNVRTTIWMISRQPAVALIVTDTGKEGRAEMCGVSDHTTPLANMANELAVRIRSKEIKTRGMGGNDVQLEDNGGSLHIVSDPGGTSTSGFFLFRAAPNS